MLLARITLSSCLLASLFHSLLPFDPRAHISRNEADFGTGYLFRTNDSRNRVLEPPTRIHSRFLSTLFARRAQEWPT